jgi:NAD(P)-dependent dehydrogenase (short-subunit alcohol dehydrogenase family)
MSDYRKTLNDDLATRRLAMQGRTALVVGGGLSGEHGSVGFATAWCLSQEGSRVIIADRDPEAAERARSLIAAEGREVAVVTGDAVDDEGCAALVADAVGVWGTIDAVMTTVASGDMTGILEVDRAGWDQMLAINLTSAWQLIRHLAPVLPPGSSIVTTSSGAAGSRGPGTPYNISKAALEQLTVGAAATLAPRGVRVNAVRVGTIWSTFASRDFSEDVRAMRAQQVAMRTEGNVWDIAAAAAFLSGAQARWITGQVLSVDGGGPTPPPPGWAGAKED